MYKTTRLHDPDNRNCNILLCIKFDSHTDRHRVRTCVHFAGVHSDNGPDFDIHEGMQATDCVGLRIRTR
jgi:hypothetical protein